jgi:hypothetical protein
MKKEKRKSGPAPTGKRLTKRATAVCNEAELAAFEAAAAGEQIRLSAWARKTLILALPQEVQEKLKQQ